MYKYILLFWFIFIVARKPVYHLVLAIMKEARVSN